MIHMQDLDSGAQGFLRPTSNNLGSLVPGMYSMYSMYIDVRAATRY